MKLSITLRSLLLLLPASNVGAYIAFVPYPDGGDCQEMFYPGGLEEWVCITGGTMFGPSPALIGDETFYFGQQGESFDFYFGDDNGVATDEFIATVQVGYEHPEVVDCVVTINGVDCCSCVSCLNESGNLVGMKADCTNLPNGRRVETCEGLNGFFPLDLSLNGDSGDCSAVRPFPDAGFFETMPTITITEDPPAASEEEEENDIPPGSNVADPQNSSDSEDGMNSGARLSSVMPLLLVEGLSMAILLLGLFW